MLAIVVLLFFPVLFLMGRAALGLLYGRRRQENLGWEDAVFTGMILMIGLAEGAHLGALLRGQSVSASSNYLLILLSVCILGGAVVWWIESRKKISTDGKREPVALSGIEKVGWMILAGMILVQLAEILFGTEVYLEQDLTLETVMTFLKEDKLYGSNPLTGFPYEQGMPSRLKILCLPTFYSVLCRWTGVAPELLIWHVIPCAVLLLHYLVYLLLGKVLFPRQSFHRTLFLIFVALLVWVEDAMYGLEGFGLLHGGYQGVTIRSAVLLPWLFSLCLRRKWKLACGALLAEACLVWTLYGLGMGAVMLAAFSILLFCKKHFFEGKEGSEWVNS